MTIYETYDRQGLKHFSKKPEFLPGHDVFSGERCREPKKRDRVIRRFTARVRKTAGGTSIEQYYPNSIRVEPRK